MDGAQQPDLSIKARMKAAYTDLRHVEIDMEGMGADAPAKDVHDAVNALKRALGKWEGEK